MNNKLLLVIAGGLFFVTIIIVFIMVLGRGGGEQKSVVLEFWGVFDDQSNFKSTIQAYEQANPNVRIVYRNFAFEDYETSLIGALAAGSGPDIWMMHNTWLPKHKDKISPLPQDKQKGDDEPIMTFRGYKDTFVDVAVQELTDGGDIYALPLYIDTLALYYNKDIFDTESVAEPPSDWNEFIDIVEQLTKFATDGGIERAGAALGTSRNVNRSTDILSLLMLQSGVEMVNDDQTLATFSEPVQGQNVGEIALQFYTDFANPTKRVYSWNDDMFYSIDAFFTGQTAMMFNYSHHVKTLREKAPRFRFDVAKMPQIEGSETINYANYWAPTVSEFSEDTVAAWKFLAYLSSPEGVIPYLNSSERPVARRDLIEEQSIETELGVFAEQALSAFSWYQVDNSAIEKIFADMIDDINFNRMSVREALSDAETKVSLLMQRR